MAIPAAGGGGGSGGHWCPIDRVVLSETLWTYTWRDCNGTSLSQSVSGNDLPLGCVVGGSACSTARPTSLETDPGTTFSLADTGGDIASPLLNAKSSGEKGLIQQTGTRVARVADTSRFIRVYEFAILSTADEKGVVSPNHSFQVGVEIDPKEADVDSGVSLELAIDSYEKVGGKSVLLLNDPKSSEKIPALPLSTR